MSHHFTEMNSSNTSSHLERLPRGYAWPQPEHTKGFPPHIPSLQLSTYQLPAHAAKEKELGGVNKGDTPLNGCKACPGVAVNSFPRGL